MKFDPPLLPGILIKRYKRFLADIELAGGPGAETVTAHCPNPGAMTGLAEPGSRVWVSRSPNPKRKLPYTWELVEADGTLVGLNTGHPNRLAEEAIRAGHIPELDGYEALRGEVKYGQNSRIDLLLSGAGRPQCFVEVKNVHLRRTPGLAEFPDSVTARGAKHLRELANVVKAGHRGVMLYVVQRGDCRNFAVAADIDPNYHREMLAARAQGVETLCYACHVSLDEVKVGPALTQTGPAPHIGTKPKD